MRHRLVILLLLIACFVFADKRALLIGIGEYPDVDYGWDAINGDNDVQLVVEMLRCNGFDTQNITTLTNRQATYDGILQAIEQLAKQAGEGDVVYIHFSGHGQQITDLNGDEADGYDEAWVPYDALQEPTADYNGERHLTDDELNFYLSEISQKIGQKGRLVVVTDACHSGTATRDISDTCIVRGSSAKFVMRKTAKSKSFVSQPIKWVAISACADNECNRQYTATKPYGSLSFALYLLRNRLSFIYLTDLQKRLQTTITPLLPRPQTPQVEVPSSYPHKTLF